MPKEKKNDNDLAASFASTRSYEALGINFKKFKHPATSTLHVPLAATSKSIDLIPYGYSAQLPALSL
jgi:hypothetical protein